VGGAEPPGGVVLGLHRVDRDDRRGAGQARALDRRDADPAAADHHDGVARTDLRGVDHSADAGHHPAADQRGHLVRHVVAELHRAHAGNHDLLGERADTGHAEHRGVADHEARLDVAHHHVGQAQVGLAAYAGRAGAARGQPVGDHPVADGQVVDPVADLDHVAGGLVAEHGRHRLG
jgi:hypothetical protein